MAASHVWRRYGSLVDRPENHTVDVCSRFMPETSLVLNRLDEAVLDVTQAERLNSEFLHSGVEIKFKALEPEVYKLIAHKPKLMKVSSELLACSAEVKM